jgi:hypothetical protein
MQKSIHYYVLSLSDHTSRLYEGFRDKLIDIQDTNFPLEILINTDNLSIKNTQLREFYLKTDQHFAHYYNQDPLGLMVVGEKNNLAVFAALKIRRDILIGTVNGDFTATTPHDLGKIIWPVVKEAIAGTNKNALRNLATAVRLNKVLSGINAVGNSMETKAGSTLYVEEDYHIKGSIHKTDNALVFSNHVDIWEVIDDVVDVIIEKVLKKGGNVIFVNSGLLTKLDRIVLIMQS